MSEQAFGAVLEQGIDTLNTSLSAEIASSESPFFIPQNADVCEIGPGELPVTEKRQGSFPMSPWPHALACRLSEQGSYTIFDLQPQDRRGGFHNARSMVETLAPVYERVAPWWNKTQVVETDIMTYEPTRQHDVLVDHGTLAEWVLQQGGKGNIEEWVPRVAKTYSELVKPGGKMILSYQPDRNPNADHAMGELLSLWRNEGFNVTERDGDDVWKLPEKQAVMLSNRGVPIDLSMHELTPNYPHSCYLVVEKPE